jgi:hypothetical protein
MRSIALRLAQHMEVVRPQADVHDLCQIADKGLCRRHRVEAIVEKFADLQADLDREKKAMTRLWAKREAQIQGVIESTVGMYGDLQGIAGSALQELEGLELPLLEGAA